MRPATLFIVGFPLVDSSRGGCAWAAESTLWLAQWRHRSRESGLLCISSNCLSLRIFDAISISHGRKSSSAGQLDPYRYNDPTFDRFRISSPTNRQVCREVRSFFHSNLQRSCALVAWRSYSPTLAWSNAKLFLSTAVGFKRQQKRRGCCFFLKDHWHGCLRPTADHYLLMSRLPVSHVVHQRYVRRLCALSIETVKMANAFMHRSTWKDWIKERRAIIIQRKPKRNYIFQWLELHTTSFAV